MKFYSPDAQGVLGPVRMLPQKGSSSGGSKRPMNSYAILREGRSILFDAAFSWTVDGIARLADDGRPPAALVLSHRNVVGSADALDEVRARFDVPVFLHPADAAHEEAASAGIEFADPMHSDLLGGAGITAMHVPGHTAGSVMLWIEDAGGVLLAGDCAVGPGPEQGGDDPDHEPRLQRPKMDEEAERAFIPAWHAAVASHPVAAILPLHGRWYRKDEVGDAVFATLQAGVTTGEPMDPSSA